MPVISNYKILGLSSSLVALSISVLMHVGIAFILMAMNVKHQDKEEVLAVELVFHEISEQAQGSNYETFMSQGDTKGNKNVIPAKLVPAGFKQGAGMTEVEVFSSEIKGAGKVTGKTRTETKKVTVKPVKKKQIYNSTKGAMVDKTGAHDIKAKYTDKTNKTNVIAADEPDILSSEQLFFVTPDSRDNILHIDNASGVSDLRQDNSISGSLTSTFYENGGGPTGVGSSTVSNNSKGAIESRFGSVDGPSFLKMVKPKYPSLARRLGKEGKVILRLFIDEHGGLINVEIVKSAGHGFDEAAVDAIKASTFNPAKVKGMPAACKAILPIRFKLE